MELPKPNEQIKQTENAEMFNLHEPAEALPEQIKKNKSVIGRISNVNYPTGPKNGFGVGGQTQFEITVQNAQQMALMNSYVEGEVKLTGSLAGKYVRYTGGHTGFTSFNAQLDGKKIADIQNNADRVTDFNLYTSKTKDELDIMESLLGAGANMKDQDTLTFRVPLSIFGCDIANLLPTGAINSTLRLNFTVSDKPLNHLYKGNTSLAGTDDITPPGSSVLTYNNIRLVSEFIELQPMVLNKMIELIESNNGLTIPYHAYYLDNRTLGAAQNVLNQRIAMSYNNIISIAQLPYKKARVAVSNDATPPVFSGGEDTNYYRNLKWNESVTGPNDIKQYLVNFEGSQYYNIASNIGQSGKAEHAQALLDSTKSDHTLSGHGSQAVKDFDNYQALCCNFVRSNSTLSASIIDSGVNARLFSSILQTSANFKDDIVENTQLTTIIKFTRRIVFKNSQLDIMS